MALFSTFAIPTPYAILLSVVALQRVLEIRHSRRNIAMLRAGRDGRSSTESHDAGARPATASGNWIAMVSVHALLIVLPALEVGFLHRGVPAWLWIASVASFVLAQALRYWSIATLGKAWNARAIVDPRAGVVTGGPYRWIRHPNYLAVLIEFSAIPLAGGAWISWLVLNAIHTPVLARRIRGEERRLALVPGYTEAMHSKNRFVPWKAGGSAAVRPFDANTTRR